jgi:succinate--hydroxymethylglutarate CoA-transferase
MYQVGVAITDICAGLFCHGAILAALLSRVSTGKGQKIESSLLEAQVRMLPQQLV